MNRLSGISSLTFLAVIFVYNLPFAGWREEVRISEPGNCSYPDIVVQGDNLHVVYTNEENGDKISYVRSGDGGHTWIEYIVLSDTLNSDEALFPRISLNDRNLLAVWDNSSNEGYRNKNIGYSLSEDNGQTWSGVEYVFHPNIDHIYYLSACNTGPIINVTYSDYLNPNPIYNNVRSTDFGQSWSGRNELFLAAETGTSDMAAYDSTFIMAWYGNFDGDDPWDTYLITSHDAGESWSGNQPLVPPDERSSRWPSITANEDGNFAICWTDFRYSPHGLSGDIFIRYSFDAGTTWVDETQLTFTHLDAYPDVCWHGDTLDVVFERGGLFNVSVYHIRSTDGGLSWSEETRLDHDDSDSYWPQVEASNGRIYVVWADFRYQPEYEIYSGIYFAHYEEGVGLDETLEIPSGYEEISVYPNPFNSTTLISYSNLKGGEIEIYDIAGRLVRTLITGGGKEGTITWDGTDATGSAVSSGIYFVRANVPEGRSSIKLVVLR